MTTSKKYYATNDIVKVLSHNPDLKDLHGKRGIIRGMSISEEDPNLVAYSVYMPFYKESWCIFQQDLESTNMRANPEFLESDFSAHVIIDPDTGNSGVVE